MSLTTPVRWWWIRHAPTLITGSPSFLGWTDAPADLSDRSALRRVQGALPAEARLLFSDLERAQATANALRRSGWSAGVADPALREMHMGEWEGRPYDALKDEAAAFWKAPADVAPPGGESFRDVCARVAEVIDRVIDRMTDREDAAAAPLANIVCVAHAGTIRAALTHALSLEPARALSFEIAPLSLTRIDWYGKEGGWGVAGVNLRYE